MKFLVDAQLPRLLAIRLIELGHVARHTLDLEKGNLTADHEITKLADSEQFVVITKDADFITSHILYGKPQKLLLISTGNITNPDLLALVTTHIQSITCALATSAFVELTADGLAVHG
jgi:predicted nuclease of predicted toxin-antitoxin system